MADGIQTANGKAFEYACVVALFNDLYGMQEVKIEESAQLNTAREVYNAIENDMRNPWIRPQKQL